MAFTSTVTHISVLLAAVCSVVLSQNPSTGLFDQLLASQSAMDPMAAQGAGVNSVMGPQDPQFSFSPNAPAPMGTQPFLGGPSNFGQPQMPNPLPQPNPMSRMLQYFMLTGRDINPMTMLFMLRGQNGGLFNNPLALMGMMNNL